MSDMTLEDLLRTKVEHHGMKTSPEFRLVVNEDRKDNSIRFYIHVNGHSSETLDFAVSGNELTKL